MDQGDVKKYYETFIQRLQRMVDTDYHASASLIELYQGLPAAVDAYMMPNGAVVGLFRLNATENRVEVFSGEFEQLRGEMRGRSYDHMVPIYPSHPTSETEIDATIKYMIETRLREINYSQYLKDVVLGIVNIEGQISEISKTNPWLSKQFGELTTMLSNTRKRAEEVSKLADEVRDRRSYERSEEVVGYLEGYDPASAPAHLAAIDNEKVRTFLTEFIRSYRATIDAKSLAKEAYPPFYSDYPYGVESILLPNKNAPVFFTKATEGMRFTDRQMSFSEFEAEVPDKQFDYLIGFPNAIPFDKQSAVSNAQAQAQVDLERHDLRMALKEIPGMLKDIEGQIIKIKKSNPWLEQNLSELLKTVDTCHKPVKKLQDRLDKQRKAGVVLLSHINLFDSSISIYPTTGEVPPSADVPAAPAAAPVYEDVATAEMQTPQGSFAPIPVTPPLPMEATGGEYELQMPGGADEAMAVTPPSMEATSTGAYESSDLNEIKSMLYTFERKLSDYEKRLHYIDKYTEMIQRQQNKKFKAQKELISLESRKGKWLGVGIGAGALTVAVIALLISLDKLMDALGGMF